MRDVYAFRIVLGVELGIYIFGLDSKECERVKRASRR
jgi:hypothetical protein